MLRSRNITQLEKISSWVRIIVQFPLCFEWGTSVWIKRYTYCILERKITISYKKDSCYHFPVILCNSMWQECRLKNFLQIISFHFQNNTLNNCISNKVASFELLFMITVSQSGIWKGSNISSLWTTWKSRPKSIAGTISFLFLRPVELI